MFFEMTFKSNVKKYKNYKDKIYHKLYSPDELKQACLALNFKQIKNTSYNFFEPLERISNKKVEQVDRQQEYSKTIKEEIPLVNELYKIHCKEGKYSSIYERKNRSDGRKEQLIQLPILPRKINQRQPKTYNVVRQEKPQISVTGYDVDIELSGILNSCPKMKILPTKVEHLENSIKINVQENSMNECLSSPRNHRNTLKIKPRNSRRISDDESFDDSLREQLKSIGSRTKINTEQSTTSMGFSSSFNRFLNDGRGEIETSLDKYAKCPPIFKQASLQRTQAFRLENSQSLTPYYNKVISPQPSAYSHVDPMKNSMIRSRRLRIQTLDQQRAEQNYYQ